MADERFFVSLAERTDAETEPLDRAPARLKSRLYSAMMLRHASTGPLCSLSTSKAQGRGLCVFERALELMPVGEPLKSTNPCRICHARVLGEHVERAPIFWAHCPYVEFRKG
jgi:hypothetical protein